MFIALVLVDIVNKSVLSVGSFSMSRLGKVKLIQEWHDLAQKFAEESLASRQGRLRQRGQTNVDKIKQDIASGVLSEFAVRYWLLQQGHMVSEPDLNIYAAKKKSWAADLVTDFGFVHVKSYSNPKWSSWVFTYNEHRNDIDPLIEEPGERDFLALTFVNLKENEVEIKFFVRAGQVINLYKEPILPQLRWSKLVLYPDDLSFVPDKVYYS